MKITLKRALVAIAAVWVFLCLLLIQLLFGEKLFPRAEVVVSLHVVRVLRLRGNGGPHHIGQMSVALIISLYDIHR